MFIATICLLVIAAYFFFNGLNEKRWIESHQHDETVAADKGFLPSFSERTTTPGGTGKVSIAQEDTFFARAVARVQSKTARIGDTFEQAAARAHGDGDPANPMPPGESFFGRSVELVRNTGAGMSAGLEERVRREKERKERAPSVTRDGTLLGRVTAKVGKVENALGDKLTKKYQDAAASTGQADSRGEEDGQFNRIVASVSRGLDGVEQRLDDTAARSRESVGSAQGLRGDDDFISRLAVRINERSQARENVRSRAAKGVQDSTQYSDHPTLNKLGEDTDLVSRLASRVGRRMGGIEQALDRKVAELKERDKAANDPDSPADSLVSSVANKLSAGVKSLDEKLDRKMADAGEQREPSPVTDPEREDLLTRVSMKIGQRVNDLDDSLVAKSRDISDAADDKFVDSSRKLGDKIDAPVDTIIKKNTPDS